MKAKNLKPMIISALLAVGFGASTVGTSFALFTDSAETNINVTAGKVDVGGELKGLKLYSAEANAEGTVLDENNAKYNLVEQTGTFKNGGTAVINETKNTLTLTNITPGDKVAFTFDLGNESNVNIKYRFGYEVVNEGQLNSLAYLDLVKGLETTIGTEKFSGLKTYKSAWTDAAANATLSDIDFSIYLPMNKDNRYQSKTAKIRVFVEAVQGNAVVIAGKEVSTIEEDIVSPAAVVEQGSATTVQATNAEESVTVKTVIPAGTTGVDAGKEVELKVSNLESEDTEDSTVKNLEFDLSLYVDGEKKESFDQLIDVEINIGKWYTIAGITHKNTVILPYDESTNPNGYKYDPAVGIITFKTSDFSPFTVSYHILRSHVQTWAELKEAVAIPHNTVYLLNDVEKPVGEYLVNAADVVISGEKAPGVKITGANEGGGTHIIRLGGNLTVKNLKFIDDVIAHWCTFIALGEYDLTLIDSEFYGGKDGENTGAQVLYSGNRGNVGNITIEGCHVEGYFGTVWGTYFNNIKDITYKNSYFDTAAYVLNTGSKAGEIAVSDCTVKGWTSFSQASPVTFTNVKFQKSSYEAKYNFLRAYSNVTFNGCTFDTDTKVEIVENAVGNLNGCYMNDIKTDVKTALSKSNLSNYHGNITLRRSESMVLDGSRINIDGELAASTTQSDELNAFPASQFEEYVGESIPVMDGQGKFMFRGEEINGSFKSGQIDGRFSGVASKEAAAELAEAYEALFADFTPSNSEETGFKYLSPNGKYLVRISYSYNDGILYLSAHWQLA